MQHIVLRVWCIAYVCMYILTYMYTHAVCAILYMKRNHLNIFSNCEYVPFKCYIY